MPINVVQKNVLMIDRTIPEIFRCKKEIERSLLYDFLHYLLSAGTDLIEIDKAAFEVVGHVCNPYNLIFRVESQDDFEICRRGDFSYCVINYDRQTTGLLENMQQKIRVPLILEVDTEGSDSIKRLEKTDLYGVSAIRLQGMNRNSIPEWLEAISWLRKKLDVKVDVCPGNLYHLATATAYELVLSPGGPDFLSVAFAGLGGRHGFAALEEFVMALKVITRLNTPGETKIFSEMSRLYRVLFTPGFSRNKPVIGEDLFKVESGIHADGIAKNPLLYEPYDPGLVGKKRDLLIGKHSGSASIRDKLRQLGLEDQGKNTETLLEQIRTMSIRLKRNLADNELLTMFNGIVRNAPTF